MQRYQHSPFYCFYLFYISTSDPKKTQQLISGNCFVKSPNQHRGGQNGKITTTQKTGEKLKTTTQVAWRRTQINKTIKEQITKARR